MQVWVLWERYFQSFDIVADESQHIVGIFSCEESAYCAQEELTEKQQDECISYFYECHDVKN
jgi:hypothetical protein